MAATSNPFAATGKWIRCALHAHTTRSDGELSPDELVSLYERAGFDVLAITDHWVRTEARSTDRLLVIPSSELSCLLPGETDGHLLAYGIDEDPLDFVRTRPDLAAASAWVGEHGGVAYLAHPYWTGAPASGLSLGNGVAGLEVYNAGCELEVGRGLSTVHWDDLLERGGRYFGIATDDSHHADFYSSAGPLVHELHLENGSVEVLCSPCQRVTLCTSPRRGSSVSAGRFGYRYAGEILSEADDEEITCARLEWPAGSLYGRLELVDSYGRKAWTNPLWT